MHHSLINVRGQDIVAFELEAPLATIPPISKQIRNIKYVSQATKIPSQEEIAPNKAPIMVSKRGES